ncbi:organic cation transporter protein-like isoform X2 [Macrobrachium nipponense]|uniref:organic cation transporter protein-like isoform X2 n=1 Tax=Macrobrachium nipponense TaxID=159736 RepID=UPI0030C83028
MKGKKKMGASKFDELLAKLGTGKWNVLYFFIAGFWYLWLPGEYFGGAYLTPQLSYTCIPSENASVISIAKDSCSYTVNETDADGYDTQVEYSCTEWEYDHSVFITTLTSDFDLVCGQAYLKATYQSALVFATMFTSMFAGYLADRFGRKNVVVVTQILFCITSISISLANNFSTVLALRFITGAFFLPTTYVLAMEVCEIKNRALVGIFTGLPWAIGTMFWGGFAYLIREWRYLRLTSSLPPLLLFPCLYLIDESPRWLILRGDDTRALKVLRKAARWNKVELPPDNELKKIFLDIRLEQAQNDIQKKPRRQTPRFDWRKIPLLILIRTPKVRLITILLSIMMFMVALSYTGVSLSGNIYGDDPFVYMVILGVTQVPSYTITAPLIKWLGRKKPIIGCFILGGVSMVTLGFIPPDISWLVLTLAMIGMFSVSSAWMMMAVYLTELFPTEVRMQGMGTTTLFCQIAGTIAPYIALYLGPLIPWVPSLIYGVCCFIAAGAAIPLRETKGKPMVETVNDLENQIVRQDAPDEDAETTKFNE